MWVAEDIDGLLQLGEILRADQDGRHVTVAGQHDPLVLVFHAVDKLRQMIADRAQRLDAHGHNCGPTRALVSNAAGKPTTAPRRAAAAGYVGAYVRAGRQVREWAKVSCKGQGAVYRGE